MSVEIKQDLVAKSMRDRKSYGTGNPTTKMVIHQTGNTGRGADAQMHADYQHNGAGGRAASWHIQSDDKNIIQSYPFTYRCYHASTGRAEDGGNMVGVGWEICINQDGNYLKSLELAAKGIAQVMKQLSIPMSGLTTHNAEDPKNQWCPAQILSGQQGVTWNDFKGMVQEAYDGEAVSTPKPKPAPTPSKTNGQVAQEVIDGKWGNNPKRRNDLIAAGYNYSTIQSIVNEKASSSSSSRKSVNTLAQEVLAGKWGNNPQRKHKLSQAGYDASAVQRKVNKLASGSSAPSKKSNSTIAKEVLDGKWGNNPQRKQRLESAGYNYSTIQSEVNNLASGGSSTPKKSVETIAREILYGRNYGGWGTGATRRNRLQNAGYDPSAVQRRVNQLA